MRRNVSNPFSVEVGLYSFRMSALAEKIKASLPGKKVAVIGDIVAGQFLNGRISRVSREAPVFIRAKAPAYVRCNK